MASVGLLLLIFYLLIFGCAGSLLLRELSLVAVIRGHEVMVCRSLLISVVSLVGEHEL